MPILIGRGPSVWDDYCQNTPENIIDGSSGNDACNSYDNYKEDVKAIKELGVKFRYNNEVAI